MIVIDKIIEQIIDPIDRAKAYQKAYEEKLIPKQHTRKRKDINGNIIREKAMVYYGETFEEALIRESNENSSEVIEK